MGDQRGPPKRQMHTERVVIDSRDRDLALFPSPNRYDVRLHEDIFDVRSIKLLVADVPFCTYTVNANNRFVPLRMAGGLRVAELPIGDYQPTELADQLATSLTLAAGDTFAVEYVPRTDNFVVTYSPSPSPPPSGPTPPPYFELAFATWEGSLPTGRSSRGTAARLLGFSPAKDYVAEADGTLRSPFRKDFWTGSRYIVLNMQPAEVLMAFSSNLEKSFAVLQSREVELCESHDVPYEKVWNPPYTRLSRFSLTFTDYDGRPWDFQNQEHRLELLVEHENMRKYQY